MEPRRLRCLPRAEVWGTEVPVASGFGARLLGLALLRRERAGPGLLIPRCRCVHTFGMRFALDLVFLDRGGQVLREMHGVGRGRIVACAGAVAVLERPSRTCTRQLRGYCGRSPEKEIEMSLIDKLTGRAKKAAGDITGDSSVRREGAREERKGEAKEDLNRAQDKADNKADEVADLERKT
jgi:uncharacterized protein